MDSSKMILVIDDAKFMSALIEMTLKKAGYQVITTESAEEAIEILKQIIPDLILLDIILPGMDGYELCEKLRADNRFNLIPIIMLTGQGQEEAKLRGLENGADDYIVKPFSNREILARIQNTLVRLERVRNVHPLTLLRGNYDIDLEIDKQLNGNSKFAVLYYDICNFKLYNDTYGFSNGDTILKKTAKTISITMNQLGRSTDFLGHIGGDEFISIVEQDTAIKLAETVIERFEKDKTSYYYETNIKNNYSEVCDYYGNQVKVPLIMLSIAILIIDPKEIHSSQELAMKATEIRKKAKLNNESFYMVYE